MVCEGRAIRYRPVVSVSGYDSAGCGGYDRLTLWGTAGRALLLGMVWARASLACPSPPAAYSKASLALRRNGRTVGGAGFTSSEYLGPGVFTAGDASPRPPSEAARFSTDVEPFSLFGVGGSSLVGGAEAASLRALRDFAPDSFLAGRGDGFAGAWPGAGGPSRASALAGRIFLRRAGQGPSFHRSTEFRMAVLSTCWRQDWQ